MAKEDKPDPKKEVSKPDANLDESRDPDELRDDELDETSGGMLTTTLSNLANMRHEMLKSVANNLRG